MRLMSYLLTYLLIESHGTPLFTRSLATANTSRVIIRVIRNFGLGRGGAVDPVKLFLAPQFDHRAKYGCCFSCCKRAYMPQNFLVHLGPTPLIWGRV